MVAADQAPLGWALRTIGLDESYNYSTGAGIKVVVLDTGVEFDHPDFRHRIETSNSRGFVASSAVTDGHGHGTHCAGIIAGPKVSMGGQRFGVAPDAILLSGKVFGDDGTGSDNAIFDGIEWAADNGARVISMSFGEDKNTESKAYEAIANRLLMESPGCLMIAAAGNSSNRPDFISPVKYPAACNSIVSVGAIDSNGSVWARSCGAVPGETGRVNFVAPGVNVYSAWLGGRFRALSGTSMAAPHVSGVAALIS